jgi:hypothetical protein
MTGCLSIVARAALGIAMLVAPALTSTASAREDRFPYSIMTPEPGTVSRHHVKSSARVKHVKTSRGRVKLLAGRPAPRKSLAVRGSPGIVLPTPLPRTPQIPPITTRIPRTRALPQDQGPTIVPGLPPIPNLPHGTETFQDRASRCAHQAGLYGVPNEQRNVYLGACSM